MPAQDITRGTRLAESVFRLQVTITLRHQCLIGCIQVNVYSSPHTRYAPPRTESYGHATIARHPWRARGRPQNCVGLGMVQAREHRRHDHCRALPVVDRRSPGLLALPEVTSAVALSPLPSDVDAVSLGTFLPAEYSWRLPARLGKHIVYIGGRDSITARMIRTALARGAKTFVFWDLNRWTRRSVRSLALYKVSSRLLGVAQTFGGMAGAAVVRIAVTAAHKSVRAEAALRGNLGSNEGVGPEDLSDPQTLNPPLLSVSLLQTPTRHRLKRLMGARSRSLRMHDGPLPHRIVLACPTLVAGGAERQIVNTAIGLHQRFGLDITVLVSRLTSPPGNDFFHQKLADAGVDVLEVQSATSSAESWERHQTLHGEHLLRELQALLGRLPAELGPEVVDTYLMLRELRPAVLHAWLDHSSVCAGLAALMAGVPRVILSGRNVSPVHFSYILRPYMRPAYRAMATRPEATFINNSHGGANDYARWLGIKPHRFEILYNGVDLDHAQATTQARINSLRRRHQIPEKALLIGGMFRLSPEKRPLLWIDTMTEVVKARPDAFGLVFGAGPMQHEIEARLQHHGVARRIMLAPPIKDSATALAAFDIALLTSRWEGTPNVAIEAQAAGTPVVLSGGGGAAEAIAHGETGLFVDHADTKEIVNAVLTLADDPALRQRLGANGPAFAEARFGLQRMLSETLELYGLSRVGAQPDETDRIGRQAFDIIGETSTP